MYIEQFLKKVDEVIRSLDERKHIEKYIDEKNKVN